MQRPRKRGATRRVLLERARHGRENHDVPGSTGCRSLRFPAGTSLWAKNSPGGFHQEMASDPEGRARGEIMRFCRDALELETPSYGDSRRRPELSGSAALEEPRTQPRSSTPPAHSLHAPEALRGRRDAPRGNSSHEPEGDPAGPLMTDTQAGPRRSRHPLHATRRRRATCSAPGDRCRTLWRGADLRRGLRPLAATS